MNITPPSKRRLLISCQVFQREIDDSLAKTANSVDVEFLPLGLHGDSAENARAAIQAAVDAVDPNAYEAVLVGYGLCNLGVRGLVARQLPLVLPRAHDCIALLFGSRQRYVEFFENQPDTHFLTSGWVDAAVRTPSPRAVESQLGLADDLPALVAKYGEDNGRYVYDQLKPRRYAQHVYVSTRCSDEPSLIEQARQDAGLCGCPLHVVSGDTQWLDALLNGPWDEARFLVTPPGKQVAVVYDDRLIDWADRDREP